MADLVKFCYAAPAVLIEHCKRKPIIERKAKTSLVGTHNKDDVAALLKWLNDRDQFAEYSEWVSVGMALALEYGSDGFPLWELVFDDKPETAELAASKWDGFASEPDEHSVTLNTFFDIAHRLGWKGSVRPATQAMFSDLPALVAAAGPSTAQGGAPIVSMMGGEEELTRVGSALLDDFMAATNGAPFNPNDLDFPRLPDTMAGRGLYAPMQDALRRLFVMAEQKPKFDIDRANGVLGVLQQLQADVLTAVISRLEAKGHKPKRRKIGHVSQNIEEQVLRGTIGFDKWERDAKTQKIESDNPDNIRFGLEYLGIELRWNGWTERMQIKGGNEKECSWADWTNLDDAIVSALLTRWRRTKTRFCPGKEFTWETFQALAHENTQDPVLDTLAALESKWDGTPRLAGWLSRYCGTPDDAYHRAVSKLIIGGMVMRARRPGCKFDFMPVFYGPQGTGKSTLAAMLALNIDWFSDTIMLGDASKELILGLAGKLVVEISEMGMRSNVNVNHIKAMISRQVDQGRTAYARTVSERPRRNIFIGTTNEEEPLSDPTGNRRFLLIRVDVAIDLPALFADVGQLIGEACAMEAKGEKFAMPADVWAAAAEVQEGARHASPIEECCLNWFDRGPGAFYIESADLMNAFRMVGLGAKVHPGVFMKKLGYRAARVGTHRSRIWIKHANNSIEQCTRLIPAQDTQNSPVVMRQRSAMGGTVAGLPMPPMPDRVAVH